MTNSPFAKASRRGVARVLVFCLVTPGLTEARCGPWQLCQLGNAAQDVGQKATDVAKGVVNGVKKVGEGVIQVGGGVGKLLTGHPSEGWASIQDGGKTIVNGVIQVAVTGVVTVVTMADPIIGTIFFGQPSPLQGLTKFLYDTISRWKNKPVCNPGEQIGRLMTIPKKTLDDPARVLGAATTPLKYLSSIFDGVDGWEVTGCDAVGIGRPVRNAQLSTDGLWTIDVAISRLDVQGSIAPPQRFIRLEVFPGVEAHSSISDRIATPTDVIKFSGPLVWDKDQDGDHPHGHMEIHPLPAIEFGARESPPPSTSQQPELTNNGTGQNTVLLDSQSKPPASQPAEYQVVKGDCLAKIAEHLYGKQQWPPVYCANRTKIENPDLIYPGQKLTLPLTDEEFQRAHCVVPR